MAAQVTQKIPKGWKETTLGEVAVLNYGEGLKSENRTRGQIPVYGSSGITGFHNEALVKEPGYIIGRKGTVGSIHYSPTSFFPIDTVYYTTKKDVKCDFSFFYYLLRTLNLEKLNFDSAVPGLSRSMAYSLQIKIPTSESEQRAIASVFTPLDNKIALLEEENKTLEATAQAIFKKWFSKDGSTLPDRWRMGRIKDLIEILSGFAFSSIDFDQNGKYKLVTIKNVQDRYFNPETKDKLLELPKKMPPYCKLQSGDILLSLTGNVGRTCLVSGEDFLLNQRVAKINPKNSTDYAFSYLLFLQNTIFSLLQSTASGTAQQNLSPIQTKEIEIIIPDRQSLNKFGTIANKLIEKINCNNSQIQTLSKLRDAILSKLMRGEVRVKESSQ